MNCVEKDKQYIVSAYARQPLEIKSGKGSLMFDADGREYIDMASGIAVNTFGIADEEWVAAVTSQLGQAQHISNLFYSDPCTGLAEKLCTKTEMKKVFFSNSGAEANECAIKAARKYSQDRYGKERCRIVTLVNSFHGRTLATLTATGQDTFHHDFTPLLEGFDYLEAGDAAGLKKIVAEGKTCAFLFEIVQGEGGVNPLDKNFVAEMAKIAVENDILLICDEVQCGNGRTGAYFAYMHYGIAPDIVSTAKGLGGGLPIGATLFGEKTKDVLTPGTHGSTFGGNPAVCAGALNIVGRIDAALLSEVRKKSDYIIRSLTGKRGIKSVSGLGLMLGIECEKSAADVVKACRDRGVIVITAKTKVRLLPALNIPWDLLEKAVSAIASACE